MPAPDRLAELRRQRTLVQEHLAWLDGEIASAEATTGVPPANAAPTSPERSGPPPAPPAPEPPRPAPAETPAAETDAQADAILGKYRAASSDLQRDVRKGCLLYFVGAFAVLAVGIALLWFALRH